MLEEEKEKTNELETQLQDLQAKYNEESMAWAQQDQRYKDMIEQSQDHAKQMELAASMLGQENLADIETKLSEKHREFDELGTQFKEFESKMVKNDEELKMKLHQNQKDMALKE